MGRRGRKGTGTLKVDSTTPSEWQEKVSIEKKKKIQKKNRF